MKEFVHLHVHSHYSMLDGMSKIPDLIKKSKKNGMYAMALTDHGNMFGIKDFIDSVNKENGKVKDAIKEQERILKNDGASSEEKQEAEYQIEQLKQQFFKPIIGIETYCARRTLYDKDKNFKGINPETGKERIVDSSGYHLILLAKNKQGYKSLCKLSSIAYTDGYYSRPRIDRNVLEQYKDGLIVCSACLGGEISQLIMAGDIASAEQSVLWFKRVFGDDYYLELQRHKTNKPNANTNTFEKQQEVNTVLVELAQKHNIKILATNDVHFVDEEHGEAHDHLICLATQKDYHDTTRMHYTKQEWLKSPTEMAEIFPDLPEALSNTIEVANKIETYSIDSDPIMPMFDIPESFGTEEQWRARFTQEDLFNEFSRNDKGDVVLSKEETERKIHKMGGYDKLYRIKFEADYLEKLVWEGAHKRYGYTFTEEQTERITFELHTIKTMGFPGYFLIVQDYIRAAREELGVSVGPGRGSAAGSVVAYCLWITDIDPLKYDLLFERFLNPDRISLPDIDVDFDDSGRGKVLDWVTEKYGKSKVAHIITYGTMATKSVIADVGRVENIPLKVVNTLKGYVPDNFPENLKDENGKPFAKPPKVTLSNCFKYVPELHNIMNGECPSALSNEVGGGEVLSSMLSYAGALEDTNRQIGIHACGVIIGADDLTNFAPVCTILDKESNENVLVTQYDGHVIESVGLIKMDFLGLKNLTIIKNAIGHIKKRTGIEINIDKIPLDDQLTYQLFCEGNTVGTFQFESAGMQKYLRELKPHVFEDLIAMNALYRPGPMDNIPDFIDRKLGRKPIEYDIPCMEKYLKDTYGITVYQEQVMLLSRLLANFTRGQSDTLRKAMGKKQIEKMNELELLFYEGGEKNGYPKEKLQKIWEEWKKFASYAFNKSHATCYSWVSYQTAYLKAHYPAEYMAAAMTSTQNDIKRVAVLMEDCKKNGVEVLAPSVNESEMDFSVNASGQIRFGLQAISGMGEAAAEAVISERETNGSFSDIFDFLRRVNMRTINRKNIEALIKAGAFDGLGNTHRAQFFSPVGNIGGKDSSGCYLDTLCRWASRVQSMSESSQMSIFDMGDDIKEDDHPPLPTNVPEWTVLEQCRYEKEALSIYLSGHPLDMYKYEMKLFANVSAVQLNNLQDLVGKEVVFAGIVTDATQGVSKNGSLYGSMTIEDYSGSYELRFFGSDITTFGQFMTKELFVCVYGRVTQYKNTSTTGEVTFSPPRLKVTKMELMADLLAKHCTTVQFTIKLDSITSDFCKTIKKTAAQHKGKTPLRAIVIDNAQNLSLMMTSHSLKVDPKTCIEALQKMNEVIQIDPIIR